MIFTENQNIAKQFTRINFKFYLAATEELSKNAFLLYVHLVNLCHGLSYCMPKNAELLKLIKVKKVHTLNNYKNELVEKGYLKIARSYEGPSAFHPIRPDKPDVIKWKNTSLPPDPTTEKMDSDLSNYKQTLESECCETAIETCHSSAGGDDVDGQANNEHKLRYGERTEYTESPHNEARLFNLLNYQLGSNGHKLSEFFDELWSTIAKHKINELDARRMYTLIVHNDLQKPSDLTELLTRKDAEYYQDKHFSYIAKTWLKDAGKLYDEPFSYEAIIDGPRGDSFSPLFTKRDFEGLTRGRS